MVRRFGLSLAALLLAAAPVEGDTTIVPVVRLTAETSIAAPPAAVWKHLTEGRSLVTWCPLWKKEANAKVTLARVGDSLDYTDQWGNGGRSVVTFLSAGAELRIAHEPQDGSYLCQSKLTLAPEGGGTRVRWVEQYTDESADADRDATAGKMAVDMESTLKALKTAAER